MTAKRSSAVAPTPGPSSTISSLAVGRAWARSCAVKARPPGLRMRLPSFANSQWPCNRAASGPERSPLANPSATGSTRSCSTAAELAHQVLGSSLPAVWFGGSCSARTRPETFPSLMPATSLSGSASLTYNTLFRKGFRGVIVVMRGPRHCTGCVAEPPHQWAGTPSELPHPPP